MRKLSSIIPLLLACVCARAQTPPKQVVFVDQKPIVIDAPAPFVDASRMLPAAYAQRSRALSASNRLLAWFIPVRSLKDFLNETPSRCRVLQVQVMKQMEPVRHDAESFKALHDETLTGTGTHQITEDDAETLFALLDLSQLRQRPGAQKLLGHAELGQDSFTLCIAVSTEGSDQFGGREIETSVTCATYILINEKVLLLTVTGPE